jgi:hypothetical protein
MDNFEQIAQTIIAQLGGKRFVKMTGARDFVATSCGVYFRLPGTPKAMIDHVHITLNSLDLYDVVYARTRGKKYKVIREVHDLYAENLQESFRQATGLETRMPRVVGI